MIVNSRTAGIQSNTTNSCGHDNQGPIDERQECLGRSAEPFAFVHEKPENTRDTVCKPTCEDSGDNAEKVVEVWNAVEMLIGE